MSVPRGPSTQRERVETARREAIRARLVGEGMLRDQIDGWLARAEQQLGPPTGAGWWEDAHAWIRERTARL